MAPLALQAFNFSGVIEVFFETRLAREEPFVQTTSLWRKRLRLGFWLQNFGLQEKPRNAYALRYATLRDATLGWKKFPTPRLLNFKLLLCFLQRKALN